jgi:hypothetical protein
MIRRRKEFTKDTKRKAFENDDPALGEISLVCSSALNQSAGPTSDTGLPWLSGLCKK